MKTKTLNIPMPEEPELAAAAIITYAGIAKRLHLELAGLPEAAGIDLTAIKADLINQAKKATPHGNFAKDDVRIYTAMFEAIETIFEPATPEDNT